MNEILIYGDIGWDNTAKSVDEQLKTFNGEPVMVRINSGGGDVYEGIAMLNALRGYAGEVTAVIESIAASAASFIAVGIGGKVIARPNAEVMIHKAWTMLAGNADEIDKAKADLARQDVKIAGIYAGKAGGELDDWLALMSAETWYTADEAQASGLVDEVQDAKQSVDASIGGSRVLAQFRYNNRAAAPPPPLARRSESAGNKLKEGDTVGIFDELAAKYGKSPEDVEKAFAGFFNESVQISGEVEVTYPNDVKIVPTEKIKVEPVIGDKPAEDAEGAEPVAAELVDAEAAGDSAAVQLAKQAGLTFAMGDVAEGFTAEVNEGGVVTITAPSGAEVGSTVDFTVLVNETPVALGVTVRSLSEETEEEQESGSESVDPVPAPPVEPALENKITVDVDTWNELQARAKFGDEAYVKAQSDAREKKVDEWIRDGRISAGLRGKAIAAIHRDEEAAVALYGSNPKNTVPRGEVGYGRQSGEGVDPDAAARRAKPNPFPKPKF